MKPTFVKRYGDSANAKMTRRVSASKHPLDGITEAQRRHIDACVHFTHNVLGNEASQRIGASLPKLSDFE